MFTEFNPNHHPAGSPIGGQFAPAKGGAKGSSISMSSGAGRSVTVHTVEEAITRILKGEVVELKDVGQVHTVLSKLAAIALDAKAKGEKAPKYNLCAVSVKGTNIFCAEKFKTKEFPDGVPRIEMPQFAGIPEPGSPADKLPRDHKGFVNGAGAFVEHLKSLGIKTSEVTIKASSLRAAQRELDGSKVAMMMASGKDLLKSKASPFISQDSYVIDGHHRWAAIVGRDAENGSLGDVSFKAIRVHAPMARVYHIANKWAKNFGINSRAVGEAAFQEFNRCHDPKTGQFTSFCTGSYHSGGEKPKTVLSPKRVGFQFGSDKRGTFRIETVSPREYDSVFGPGEAAKQRAKGKTLVRHSTLSGQSYLTALSRQELIHMRGAGRVPLPD